MSTEILLDNPFRPTSHPVSFFYLKHQNLVWNVRCVLISAALFVEDIDRHSVDLSRLHLIIVCAMQGWSSDPKLWSLFGSPIFLMDIIFKTWIWISAVQSVRSVCSNPRNHVFLALSLKDCVICNPPRP